MLGVTNCLLFGIGEMIHEAINKDDSGLEKKEE
jgi:hypothetical protein